MPLGFNDLMEGYFRTLCVGYGIYAVANTILRCFLYFTDYKGALAASDVLQEELCFYGNVPCFSQEYIMVSDFTGSAVFFLCSLSSDYYTKRLPYYILSVQPVVARKKRGKFLQTWFFLSKNWKGVRTVKKYKKLHVFLPEV